MIDLSFMRTIEGLSGDRIPPAYRVPSVDPASVAPYRSRIEALDSALPRLVSCFHRCLGMPDLEGVVDLCLEELNLSSDQLSPAALLGGLYRNLLQEDDAEGYVVITALFARLQDRGLVELSAREFLLETARRYAAHTSYLFPVLHEQAAAALTMSRVSNRSRIRLFLRDALVFWPSLQALRPRIFEIPLDFLVYTRPLKESGGYPLVFSEESEGMVKPGALECLPRSLVLDVGLYGTLVKDLDRKGFFGGDGSVMFFGSRNPHILGFLNELRLRGDSGGRVVQQRDVVRYVDTVECLLKPFLFAPCPDSNRVFLELGDGISFVCSAVFLWSLYRYSIEVDNSESNHMTEKMFLPNSNSRNNRWLLPVPIPAWSKAKEFLSTWSSDDLTSAEEVREWLVRWRGRNVA
ncbi:MAG: hypothetical protein JSW71_09600 [Gemmatimonadota bacterium]|nr:MAG: hypothetical protein JSW71_09600 [Gemmatimonadota bacterium]